MTAPACGSCKAPVADAYLCAGCTRDLAQLLLQAADIAPDLDDAVARLLRRGSGGKGSGGDAPSPVDWTASEAVYRLRGALLRMVTEMVTDIREYPGCGIAVMARWLLSRLSDIRQHYDAPPELAILRDAVHRALAVVDRKPERAPAGLCDNCGRQLLAELGADSVTCACGMTLTGLIAWRRQRAADADMLGTPAEISAFCKNVLGIGIPRGTITSSVSRGRLTLRPGNVVALSDVLALHAQSQARAGRP